MRRSTVSALLTIATSLAILPSEGAAQARRVVERAQVTDATIQAWKRYLVTHTNQGSYAEWNNIAPDRAVSELRPFLFDVDPEIRIAAGWAIGGLRAHPASGALAIAAGIDSASDNTSKVRLAEAVSMYRAAASPAVPALIRALPSTEKEGVADRIIGALALIGPAAAPAADAVLTMAEDSSVAFYGSNNAATWQYVVGVGSSLAPQAARLVHLLSLGRIGGFGDTLVVATVGKLGLPAFNALVRALSTKPADMGAGSSLFLAVGYTRNPAAIPILLRYATGAYDANWASEGMDIRVAAINGLAAMGAAGGPALPELSELSDRYNSTHSDGDLGPSLAAQKAIHKIRMSQLSH